MYDFSTLRALVVVHIFEKINPVDLGNIPMSHRKIIRVSDARQYPFQFEWRGVKSQSDGHQKKKKKKAAPLF